MPQLHIVVGGEVHSLSFEPGASLRDILEATRFRVRSACRGNGACGLCRVRLLAGEGGALTPSERIHLHPGLLRGGERLACQVRPVGDLTVEVVNRAPPSNWRSTPEGFWQRGEVRAHDAPWRGQGVRHPCGVAVDVGTTNICLSLFDLESGRWLADRWGGNPQAVHGADVLSRLMAAAEAPQTAKEMKELVVGAVAEALQDIATRNGFDLRRVVCVTLVGNTAMLALLGGCDPGALLHPENWVKPLGCSLDDVAPWGARWGVHPQAGIELVEPLAGFIGSDLLAGLVAVRLTEGDAPALFIDVGTNSEVALWDGGALWVTSAAGGPAFESGVGFGMPAQPGAVYRVTREGEGLKFHILGDDRAEGICGSGFVDLIARLREVGLLSELGTFPGGGAFRYLAGGREMVLTKRDVDAFQRAKAAIGVAVVALCREAGVAVDDLRRVCIAGAFGRYLDIASAQSIGLVPSSPPERVELAGNTALAGCSDLLLSSLASERLTRLRNLPPRVVNLARYTAFDEVFMDNLFLRPLRC